MNAFFDEVWRRLEACLEQTEQEPDPLRRYQAGIVALKKALADLRATVSQQPFPEMAAEVYYFRHQVPKVYSQLFLLQRLADLEQYRAFVPPQKFRDRLEQELTEIEQFYGRHKDLAQGNPMSQSPWDDVLFTRQETSDWSALEVGVFISTDFTIGSYIEAIMQANKSLVSWLLEELDEPGRQAVQRRVIKLGWTANQVDLVELLYALHLSGCFNHGKGTLKDTMEWFEDQLGVKLGSYHNTFQDIARRKICPTKFLDRLKELLKEKIDNI